MTTDADVGIGQIATAIVANSDDAEFLEELADQHDIVVETSGDEVKKAFSRAAAQRMRELAEWLKENDQ